MRVETGELGENDVVPSVRGDERGVVPSDELSSGDFPSLGIPLSTLTLWGSRLHRLLGISGLWLLRSKSVLGLRWSKSGLWRGSTALLDLGRDKADFAEMVVIADTTEHCVMLAGLAVKVGCASTLASEVL